MMTAALQQQPSLFTRLRAAVGLKHASPSDHSRPDAREVNGPTSLPLEAEIQRRVRTVERDRWVPVGSTYCALRPASFSPGVPPAWSLLIPRSAVFQVGDRLVIGERVFQPVVISAMREPDMRELVALEQWLP